MHLLIQSIITNGWTSPIVVTPDYVIIDGYHRYLASGMEPLFTTLAGKVPVVIVQHDDPAKNIYGTITHNRARGVHLLAPMKAAIQRLLAAGKSTEEIAHELGMRPEEIFRLSNFSRDDFLKIMAKGTAYSPAKAFFDV